MDGPRARGINMPHVVVGEGMIVPQDLGKVEVLTKTVAHEAIDDLVRRLLQLIVAPTA
jgi:hypothetical protein